MKLNQFNDGYCDAVIVMQFILSILYYLWLLYNTIYGYCVAVDMFSNHRYGQLPGGPWWGPCTSRHLQEDDEELTEEEVLEIGCRK